MSAEKRRSHRIRAHIQVKMRFADGGSETTEHIKNVSLGGVFIQMKDPLAFGSEMDLEFSLPGGARVIRCKGFVTWSTKSSPERIKEAGPGVGVRLTEIEIDEMRTLAEYIEGEM